MMLRSTLTLFLAFQIVFSFAQETQTTYYANSWLTVIAPRSKAAYQKTVTTHGPEKIVTVLRLKTGDTLSREHYNGEEPIRKWIVTTPDEKMINLDYDFKILYASAVCKIDSNFIDFKKIKVYTFSDNDSLGYIAPKISTGEKNINQFIQRRIQYPRAALEQEISGTVLAQVVIGYSGEIESVSVIRGINILMDKEAVRMMRQLKFSNGASIGKLTKKICALVPIRFVIGD